VIKISIESTNEIKKFIVEDLYRKNFQVNVNELFDIDSDWFLVKIPYEGIKNEILSIAVNDANIDYLIYTGYFENIKNEKFQPATAVWEEGFFKIWLHKNVGYLKHCLIDQISNGDFGTNLFNEYMLTVDYSTKIDDMYPSDIKKYYEYPFGPVWWKKRDLTCPYKILDNTEFNNIDKDVLVDNIKQLPGVNARYINKNWYVYGLKEKSELPLVDISYFSSELKKLIDLVGYKSIIDVGVQYLNAKSSISLHVDDHLKRQCWPYIAGCKKLYWNLTPIESAYFKLGTAGLLPLEHPLLINSGMHTHSLINDSNFTRAVVIIYGELDDSSTFKELTLN
jgi:hypothetical protein